MESLSTLQGIGKVRLTAMHAAGIFSLRDLLYLVPVQYRDASHISPIAQAQAGVKGLFAVRRVGEPKLSRFGKTSRITCRFVDDTGEMEGCWFNQPWMKENLMKRTAFSFFGAPRRYGNKWQLLNPTIEEECRIVPVYRPIDGLPQKTHQAIVRQAIEKASELCPETISEAIRQRYQLMGAAEAIRILHMPEQMDTLRLARRRIAFERLLVYQAAVRMVKSQRRRGLPMPADGQESFWASLPFAPTGAQRRTLKEIGADMASPMAMARMVQGDVGCGKTAIAFGAITLCIRAGYQAAFMVPTEILAAQHFESAQEYLERQGIRCGLLTGSMPAAKRREALQCIADGSWQCVIGTHALIQKGVAYKNLGLCITDEQHRFGVAQRTALIQKGVVEGERGAAEGEGDFAPHLLVMSATPIPRTLALVMFGDLDISIVDELPPGRMAVKTRIVSQSKRADMYGFLRDALEKGQQAYIVCPLVEDSEEEDKLKAATSHVEELRMGPLKGFSLGLTHGKQPPAEKEKTLQAFSRGDVQALVATTVIEVGVNVPNATLMVIEDADRFGLAQLHQLRGRVGRGSQQSWCFLLSEPTERLQALVQTNDGFEIARTDLEMRGPGEILGTAQHGNGGILGDQVAATGKGGGLELVYEAAQCVEEMAADPAREKEWEALQALAQGYVDQISRTVSIS